MALTITPNILRDFRGLPTVTEGGTVEWRIVMRAAEGKSLRKRPGSPVAEVRNWSAA